MTNGLVNTKRDSFEYYFYTRHENEVTERFLELDTSEVPKGTILDGEIIIKDKDGKPDFEELMSRFQVSLKVAFIY